MNDFLPENYKVSNGGGKYLKLKQGDTKIRIVGNPIIGWVDRKEEDGKRKPVRTEEKPKTSFDPEKPAKEFRAMPVYSYEDEDIMCYELTQNGIKKAIHTLWKDEDRGDPKGYDLKITREGEKLETRYTITPSNKKENKDIDMKVKDYVITMEELFNNGEPIREAGAEDKGDYPF